MTEDIRPMWLKLARRCQSVFGGGRSQRLPEGFAVMRVTILVAPDGDPVFWAEPEVRCFEPSSSAQLFLLQVIEKLGP